MKNCTVLYAKKREQERCCCTKGRLHFAVRVPDVSSKGQTLTGAARKHRLHQSQPPPQAARTKITPP